MTFEEIAEMLDSTGYSVTYLAWPEKKVPRLPYICYYYPLYTKTKQFSVESTVESVLLDAGMVFTKEETFLSDENMYEVLYMMEVVING